MSKFFYRGKPDIMGKHNQGTYQPKPKVKLGSAENPLQLSVQTEQRLHEVQAIAEQHQLIAQISIDATLPEDITALTLTINKPTTQIVEKTPQRNDPCTCGSGEKYKKCCA